MKITYSARWIWAGLAALFTKSYYFVLNYENEQTVISS